ncbi:MAG TPA: ABC transporter permease, partial [Planctomycetaceae bacterium]|nr:ABC transporter permease [Planctomycetaceae bacterium]HIQ19625.1 ABC transporter permease [Planctomycetota bacterium]
MYKLLLCLRYLRTRYIALASIISVMLGVATMIVVNSVMAGFTTEMRNRIHGILSDLVFESRSLEGFPDAEWHMAQIRGVAGQWIEGMTPTVVVPAMIGITVGDTTVSQPVQLIGIDAHTHSQVSVFGQFLQHPENRRKLSFQLREGGYDVYDHQAGEKAKPRRQMADAGWKHRRLMARFHRMTGAAGTGGPGGDPAASP